MVWDGGSEPLVVPTRWALLGVALGGACNLNLNKNDKILKYIYHRRKKWPATGPIYRVAYIYRVEPERCVSSDPMRSHLLNRVK